MTDTLFPYTTLFRSILKEVMTNEASVLMDSDASNKAADADMALQELGADEAGIAYVTATVTVWDRDPALAAEKLRLVEKNVQSRSEERRGGKECVSSCRARGAADT